MAKRVTKGFADKTAKALRDARPHCPTCGEAYELVKHISCDQNTEKNTLKFKEQMVRLCKCNRSEYYQ